MALSSRPRLPPFAVLRLALSMTCLASSYTAGEQCYSVCRCSTSGSVNCRYRGLVEIPAFTNPSQIRKLDLSNNQLTSVSQSAFASMTNLQYLSLRYNPLQNVDHIWSDLSSLSQLNMQSCQLTKIPTGLPDHLKRLKLFDNSLTFVAATDLIGMRYLEYIDLDDNRIETIEDGTFTNMPHLNRVDVRRNRLRLLPNSIPASVEMLYANSNQIQRVSPSSFAHDSKMDRLNLFNNAITYLAADTFSRLTHLRILVLDDNKIQVMSQMTYSRLQNLEFLDLRSNPVREVETGALAGLSGLSTLILSEIKGEVTGITGDTFRDTPSLTNLYLRGSPNLVTLILNNTDVLRGLSSLTHLDLTNTNLRHLDVDVLSWLPNLKRVALQDNPWQCDDKLLPLRRALEKSPRMFDEVEGNNIFKSINQIICQYPEYLSRTPVIKLKYEQFTPMTTMPTATTKTMTTSTTPSSPTPSSESASSENTEYESITSDTTSRSLSSTVTTERSTPTSGSPSKTLLSSTTARSMTLSTTPSSSLQTSASATNENTDGESTTNRSKKDDHTKAMIIGVSVYLIVLAFVTIAIVILVR